MMRKFTAAALVALFAAVALAGVASSGTPHAQKWTVITTPGHKTRVIASGLVNAKGIVTDHVVLNPNGTFDNHAIQVFKDGHLFYHGAGTYKLTMNPKNCTGKGHVIGPFQITGGTGAYKGASGKGVALIDLRFYFKKTAAGCSRVPMRTYGLAKATGTLSLP